MKLIDLTLNLETDMPTCGTKWHQKVKVEQLGKIDDVGRNTSKIVFGSHSGTHMDAPKHFIQNGKTIEQLDMNNLIGPAKVVFFTNKKSGSIVELEDVENIEVTEKMIFVFGWYKNWKTDRYYKEFPYFSEEAIKYLVKKGMKTIAMDTPSPDNGGNINDKKCDSPNHKYMLKKGIVIIEYLNNTKKLKKDKKYKLIALPLKIKGSDGSPARVIVEEYDD